MKLSAEQTAQIAEQGFLLLPSLFSPPEIDVVRGAVPHLLLRTGPEVVREDDDPSTVKMVFGAHEYNDIFRRLARHPRLLQPVEQILGDRAHLFQSRLNAKLSFRSSGWAWHQDFNQWYRLDGMLTPRAVVAGVFLDDVNPCNAPLMVIPGSHRRGHIFNPSSMDIGAEAVEEAAREGGIVPLMGPPGTVAFFDCLIIHGSTANISPWPRRIFYLNYSPVSIREMQPLRSSYRCDPDVKPLAPLADDCLLERRATA